MEDREHNARLLKIHRRNLEVLLERKAQFGLEVPLSLENQIKAEQDSIALYEPLVPSTKAQEVAQTVSGGIDLTTLYIQGTQIASEQARQSEQNKDIVAQNKEIIDQQAVDTLWRLQTKEVIHEVVQRQASVEKVSDERYGKEQTVRTQRQQETDERFSMIEQALEAIQEQVGLFVHWVNWIRRLLVALIIVAGLALVMVYRYLGG